MASGYVYILTNPSFPNDMLKIGKTTRSVAQRAKELSGGTGIPTKFEIAYKVKVPDCDKAEKKIHKELDSFRNSQNREFFQVSLDKAVVIVWSIAESLIRHKLSIEEWELKREDGSEETPFEKGAREARNAIFKRLEEKDPDAWDPSAWEISK